MIESNYLCRDNSHAYTCLNQNNDEVKFVIGDKVDFKWAESKIKEYDIENKCAILFSSVYNEIKYQKVVEWMLKSKIKARFQLQIHKHIWEEETKGV